MNRQAARELYARLFLSMSMAEAKELLGFPPSATPNEAEVRKALRIKSFEVHPDRGGDPRKMVELSVAADILQGKRTDDLTRVTRSPEEEQRRQEELERQKDLATLVQAEDGASKAVMHMIRNATSIKVSYHLNLRNFMTNDLAYAAGDLQEAAEEALRDRDLDPKHKRLWQQVKKIEVIGGRALRISGMITKMWIQFKQIRKSEEVTMRDIDALWKHVDKFREAFHEFTKAFDKYTAWVGSHKVEPIVPSDMIDKVVEPVMEVYRMVKSFDDHFQSVKRDKRFESDLEKAVEQAKEVADRRGISVPSNWQDWKVSADFMKIENQVDRTKTAARRVAKRYRSANVAKTILEQMGGNRLFAMLGAQILNTTSNSVTFKWPNKQRSKGNAVKITLQPDDTYDMIFFNVSGRGSKKVKEYNDVYADQLVELFEKQTGWYLRM